ncbi:MAG: reverse transcriptase domain-containing protein [Wolbachia sp.]
MAAGVPQGSVLSSIVYIFYTADVPISPSTLLASFADDTALLSSNPDPAVVSEDLQRHITCIADWCRQWKMNINENRLH